MLSIPSAAAMTQTKLSGRRQPATPGDKFQRSTKPIKKLKSTMKKEKKKKKHGIKIKFMKSGGKKSIE